jgi:aminoglycoside phosphotransferase (APT) family kinase protein
MPSTSDDEAQDAAAPPGIDAARATGWLASALPELAPPLRFARIGEGQSNLTYLVTDSGGREVVLRRPPLGHLLPSAHDVAREHRILTALAGAGAAVPATRALCEDEAVLGAPFYVMDYARGVILSTVAAAELLSPQARRTAGRSLATTLAELHAVDLDAVGLGEMRRPESLASRQLRRWTKQWHASKTRELPLIDDLAERLGALLPQEREAVLVHGDYRLDNVVFGADGTARAVLDWELATTGDPLADLGLMLAYWDELGRAALEPGALFREAVTEVPGFPSAEQLAADYAAASGRDIGALGVWIAFGYWKLAVIIEGVYRRWLNDPANGAGAGAFGPAVPRLAEAARRALDG